MKIYCTDHYVLPLPAGHRFPMRKYAALRERVGAIAASRMREPAAAAVLDLVRVHEASYVDGMMAGTIEPAAMRRIGFPWSPAMVERSRRSTGATIAACRSALHDGCGINLAGGTHHAHAGFGEGFCVFNDAAVAARVLQAEGAGNVVIVDLDVHQGDGTASIFTGDPSVFTFSMHGRGNFPFRKATSDLDVELMDGTGDAAYLATLEVALPRVLAAAQPSLAIYLAGADPYAGDRLGRLALTKEGLRRRDAQVLGMLRDRHLPVAVVMAGGYAEDIEDIVDIHFATVCTALEFFAANAVPAVAPKPRISTRAGWNAAPDPTLPTC